MEFVFFTCSHDIYCHGCKCINSYISCAYVWRALSTRSAVYLSLPKTLKCVVPTSALMTNSGVYLSLPKTLKCVVPTSALMTNSGEERLGLEWLDDRRCDHVNTSIVLQSRVTRLPKAIWGHRAWCEKAPCA